MRRRKPVERQTTAPWANIERTKEGSSVSLPDEVMAMAAKEYVDENEK
ncbi:MAG: DUF3787 domain-containing protein [Lentisphaerae bacterium]|nr:DUF3787 domain-containing protein [Lentisphaerota bacterium]